MRGFGTHALGAHALAFALSAFVGGALQQLLMVEVLDAHQTQSALIPFLAIVLLVSIVLGITAWLAKSVSGLNKAAGWLAGLVLLLGVAALIFGAVKSSPGVGGNILWGLAILLDVAFLLPGAAAILIHWWLLRRPWQQGT
jgi:hypothetical protein